MVEEPRSEGLNWGVLPEVISFSGTNVPSPDGDQESVYIRLFTNTGEYSFEFPSEVAIELLEFLDRVFPLGK